MTFKFENGQPVDVDYEDYHEGYTEMMKNPAHPGELVGDILAKLGVSLDEAADALGVPSTDLRDVITSRTAISAEMAVRLEKSLGSTAGAWLRMQDNYDLAHIEASSIEVRRLRA